MDRAVEGMYPYSETQPLHDTTPASTVVSSFPFFNAYIWVPLLLTIPCCFRRPHTSGSTKYLPALPASLSNNVTAVCSLGLSPRILFPRQNGHIFGLDCSLLIQSDISVLIVSNTCRFQSKPVEHSIDCTLAFSLCGLQYWTPCFHSLSTETKPTPTPLLQLLREVATRNPLSFMGSSIMNLTIFWPSCLAGEFHFSFLLLDQ